MMGRNSNKLLALTSLAAVASSGVNAQAGVTTSDYPNATSSGLNNTLWNAQSPPYYPSPWLDASTDQKWAEAIQKAQAFVKQLTLMEKVNLTTGVGWEGEACVGNVGSIPRLAFKSLCLQDSPTAVRDTDFNSVFPAGGTVATSWDRELWYERGYAMGQEFAGKGVDAQLGPVVGPLGRSPEGGRNWEGFSPDPVLSGIAVAQTVKGIQDAGVIATTKHYILNEQEHFRQVPEAEGYGFNITETVSSNIDDVTMHELYLWPFADAVRAGTGSVMCSYQQINNSYGCANSHTLNYLLKGELGFQGFVMSDWQAQHSGVSTALAGLDMSMPGDTIFNSGRSYWGSNLTIAVLNGSVPEWRLDDMSSRILAAYYLVGRDENEIDPNFSSWTLDTYGYQHAYAEEGYGIVNQHVDVRGEHARLIRDHAARSTVLLKNTQSALPLTGNEKFTSIFGEDADSNLYGANGCSDRGCDNGTLGIGWGSGTGNYPYLITPLAAISYELISTGQVVQSVTDNYAYDEMTALARQTSENAGVAIVFINADSGEGYISVDGNEGDRKNLTAWHDGDKLVKNVTAECNNTIVVVHSVGPILMTPWYDNDNVTAIVWASLPGEQSGNSLADILYGRVNPGGKLPFTLGAAREDYGTDVLYEPNNGMDAPQDNFLEGNFIDYRYFDKEKIEPLYEFGFGLSYTTFSYGNLSIKQHQSSPYTPNSGMTSPAPVYANSSKDASDYLFPSNATRIPFYIYPNLNSTDFEDSYGGTDYGSNDFIPENALNGSAQSKLPAGGGSGGNPQLWDVLFTVSCSVTNTGKVYGEEVAQLYVNLGGANDPKVVLRNFDRLRIAPGQTVTFDADLTRRDLSNWSPAEQNWVITNSTKIVYVGSSSRKLHAQGSLNMNGGGGYGRRH